MRIPHTLLILSFALFCQVASATTHFIQVGQGGGNNFAPTFVIIVPGDTVQWDWVTGTHSVTSGTPGNPDGIFDSGISGTPNTFSFTFNTPANYPFYCNVHGAMMTGTIYVAVVDPPTPTVGPTATATATPTPTAPVATPSPTPPPPATPTPSPDPCDWSSAATFPIAISQTAVTSLNGNLYTFGGRVFGQYTSASYKFDVIKSWAPIAPMPAPLGGSMATNDGTFIYILGGTSGFSPVNTMYRYDPSTDTYTTMAPFFTAVSDGAAVYLAGKIYKMMGETASAATNVLEIYTVATNTWTSGAGVGPPPYGRGAHIGAFLQGNYIYVAGGSFPGSSPTNKTFRYDTVTNTWDDAAIADLPEPRYGAASAFYIGGGVLAGGYVGVGLVPPLSASTIRWDPITNTWTDLPDLPEERALMGGALLHGNFHIVGGGTLAEPFGTNGHLKLPPCLPTPVPTPSPTPTGTPGPNGKIAFSSNRDGNFEIYVMDPDGSHVIRLTSDHESNFEPAWSPDGTKIAFSSNRGPGNRGIYVMNPDGSGVTLLTHHPASDEAPAWSPDGTKIAFTRGLLDENVEIYVMNADGSNQTRLTDNYPVDDFAPAWSPDGTRIAFSTNRHDPGQYNYEIYVMDAGGGNEVRLTNDPGQDVWPAYSPDGTRIAFAKAGNGIFVMNADGSNPTRLTESSTGAYYPEWSPDGTKIVSAGYPAGGLNEIIVIDANGANPNNLTNNPAVDEHPSWQRKPTSTPVPAQALNISTRMRVETGANVLIGGFIVTGTAPKTVAVRALGPSLGQLGIGDTLADPMLDLRGPTGALLQQNDNWQDDPEQANQLTSLGLPLQNPNESGLVATLSPQSYTAIVSGKNAGTGVGLVEVYDINPSPDSQLANISTRGFVSTGSNVMIGGFILGGGNNTHVAVRGIGPSLAQFGLSPLLANPTVELRDSNGALLVSNDNWQDNVVSASHLTAFGLALQDAAESGIYIGLPPGAFTAILTGQNAGTGIGVLEIYNLP